MSDREAFEKWAEGKLFLAWNKGRYSAYDTQRAWEAWQAAQAQALLEVIRDDSGCPTEVRIAQAQVVPEGCAIIDLDDLRAILTARERGFDIDYIESYVRDLIEAAKRQEVGNE